MAGVGTVFVVQILVRVVYNFRMVVCRPEKPRKVYVIALCDIHMVEAITPSPTPT